MADNGRAAFPTEQGSCPDGTWNQTYDAGMTLWEYYAGQALVGIESRASEGYKDPADSAHRAAEVADEMMALINTRFGEKTND